MTENTLAGASGGPTNALETTVATHPLAAPCETFSAPKRQGPNRLPTDPEALAQARALAHEAARQKREAWAKLTLRQTWADEAFMRSHLRAAGIRIASALEPATQLRLRQLLRRAGVLGGEFIDSTGLSVSAFLCANPNLPLWAAVALVLEATGRFPPR